MADAILWENGDRILWENADVMVWEGTDGIAATDSFTDGRIYQRSAGATAKSFTFSGTYAGVTPTAVQIRIVSSADASVVQDWTALTGATIAGGTWSGTLSVAQGGWFNFLARSVDAGGIEIVASAQSSADWGVGVLVACIGQSNMANMSAVSGSPPTADDRTKRFTASGWGAVVGNGAIRLANLLEVGANVPIGLLDYALSGTGLHAAYGGAGYWMDLTGGAPYPLFATGLTAAGGDCEFVLWHQGESDALNSISKADYKADLDTLYGRIRTATGRSTSTLKFGVAILGTNASASTTDASTDAIRQAHLEWVRDTAGAFWAGSSVDIARTDDFHWAAAGYERMARRYAQAVLAQTGAVATGAGGPSISGAIRASGSAVVVVSVAQSGGTGLTEADGSTDGGSVTGFEVSNDDFATTLTVSSTAFSGNTVQLTLSGVPSGTVKVRYQYGKNPTVSNAVYDNTAPQSDSIGLPLQPTIGSVTVTESDTATATFSRRNQSGINFFGSRR